MKVAFLVIVLIIETALLAGAGYLFIRYSENRRMISALVKKVEILDRENKTLIDTRKRLENESKVQKAAVAKMTDDKKQMEKEMAQLQGQMQIVEGLKEGDLQGVRVRLKQLKINLADRLPAGEADVPAITQGKDPFENKRLFEEIFRELNGITQNDLGVMYSRARQFDKAIEACEKAFKNNPRNAEAYYNLGVLYAYAKKDAGKAIEYYRLYLDYAPEADDRDAVQATVRDLAAFGSTNELPGENKVLLNSVSDGK